ncbi:hypothetical protein, partial [Faecalibaculum rodentium]|uniref:hypothetical protein n=1 Tax=Faecalibaculum rodentium TaxID=1702221 RepID=UPI0025AF558C
PAGIWGAVSWDVSPFLFLLTLLLYTSGFRLSIDIYRFSIFLSRYSIVIYRTTAGDCRRFPNRILHGIQAF